MDGPLLLVGSVLVGLEDGPDLLSGKLGLVVGETAIRRGSCLHER